MSAPALVSPVVAVAAGVAAVLALMLALRVHAFLALLTGALLVSLLTYGPGGAVAPVLERFGDFVGRIGIVIALAAVIGRCLLRSGAATRIVEALVGLVGVRRAPQGLAAGGFVLAIPVFFDTVFYLLVPLAQALHRRTAAGYGLCLMALAVGAAGAHALVPPTPGPLLVAEAFGVGIGEMAGIGLLVAVPACALAFAAARLLDRLTPLSPAESPIVAPDPEGEGANAPPLRRVPLAAALAPVALPLALIGAREAARGLGVGGPASLRATLDLLGDPNVALFVAAVGALAVLAYARRADPRSLAAEIEESLSGAGVIILITAAGGAFGASLQATGVDGVIADTFDLAAAGTAALLFGTFALASALKLAQGSSTVAMIVGSGVLAAVLDATTLPFHPVYLALAVGAGSLVGSWMNDSAFWVFAKMGGLSTEQTLRTWTPAFASVGVAAMAIIAVLAALWPMR